MSKDLFSSRTPFEKCYLVENVKHLSFIPGNRTLRTAHVNRIFKAFLDGEWIPPIYVSADGEVLDGQNRLAAFRMLKEKYPQNKTAIRVIIINSDASPLNLAIKFNAGHANWVITDYMKAYLEKVFMAISSSRISQKLSLSSNSRQLFSWSRVRTLRESSITVS